jgi:excisionase family DNA binding protein
MARPTAPPSSLRLESLQSAADRHGVHRETIRRMIRRGQLTGYRTAGGRLIRVDVDEADATLRPIPTVGSGPDAAA